jgi:hypothetical protein
MVAVPHDYVATGERSNSVLPKYYIGKADNVAPLNTHVPTERRSGFSSEIPSGRKEKGDCA